MYKKIALTAAGLIVLAAVILFIRINHEFGQMEINTDNVIVKEPDAPSIESLDATVDEPTKEEDPEDFYMLMIGLDQRGKSLMLNTDSLIVAHVVPQSKHVRLLSIPRDQRVTNQDGRSIKINAVFAEGYQHAVQEARKDPSLLSGKRVSIGKIKVHEEYISSGIVELRKTIDRFLDINIEHTFLVNFETVVELVDAVGGIEVMVDRSMQYDAEFDNTHIHLEKGLQVLDGRNALNFARFREDNRGTAYFSNDFERGERQQTVINSLVRKLASWGNLTKAVSLLDIVTSNVKTDMKMTQMVSLMREFYSSLSGDSIVSIPYNGYWKNPYVEVKDEDMAVMLEQFKSIELPEEATMQTEIPSA